MWKPVHLAGWGRTNSIAARLARPERIKDAAAVLRDDLPVGIIARGAGRSYGDAAQLRGGGVLSTARLDRILDFDPQTGFLAAEAGVRFDDLMRLFLPRGFMAPVTPGTAAVTLGGAVAADIHGKNHETAGSFGRHLEWIDLMTPDGARHRLAPDTEAFRATVGGMGLTGLIIAVGLRLSPVRGNAVRVHFQRMKGLEDFIQAFRMHAAPYSVGWIDLQAQGVALGRGILELGDDRGDYITPHEGRRFRWPLSGPSFAIQKSTVALFNAFHFRHIPKNGRESIWPWRRFFYPLDAIQDWNRVYGHRGFRQFQILLPWDEAERGLRALLTAAQKSNLPLPLGVIKAMGPGPEAGFLSFGGPGITLALDVPNRRGTFDLFRKLESVSRDHNGRIYLAKDSMLSPDGFAAMYPGLEAFRAAQARLDPAGRMQSDLARRLGILNRA